MYIIYCSVLIHRLYHGLLHSTEPILYVVYTVHFDTIITI
jgi:hypothetical protein